MTSVLFETKWIVVFAQPLKIKKTFQTYLVFLLPLTSWNILLYILLIFML